jgi:hypothetical protein
MLGRVKGVEHTDPPANPPDWYYYSTNTSVVSVLSQTLEKGNTTLPFLSRVRVRFIDFNTHSSLKFMELRGNVNFFVAMCKRRKIKDVHNFVPDAEMTPLQVIGAVA